MPWLVDELNAYLGDEAKREGVIETEVPGLILFQSVADRLTRKVIYKPVVCAVVQGVKRVRLGATVATCAEGQMLAIGFDALIESTILRGTPQKPYRALSIELDFALLQEIAAHMPEIKPAEEKKLHGLFLTERSEALADAMRRLFLVVQRPRLAPVLAPGIHREIAYHLLSGPRGRDFLRFSYPGSQTRLLSGAVHEIQRDLGRTLHVGELAASVGMSPSLFHQRFKELTSYSPIQFQKRLRLLEARRLMLNEGVHAGMAAYRVGYQSPSQFSREYARLFGASPRRDVSGGRVAAQPARSMRRLEA